MTKIFSTGLIASALFLFAGSASAYVADGMEYDLTCTKDGFVLSSLYPVVRMTGIGVDQQQSRGIEKIYLGKSCDAFHKIYGKGNWCWANGGFTAEFPDHSFGFGRQELRCPAAVDYDMNCGC